MQDFIRLLPDSANYFVRRIYTVMAFVEYRVIIAVANISNKPAILISNEKHTKVYFPTNLQYSFTSNENVSLLAYKDDRMWFYEKRTFRGQTTCQLGFGKPPNLSWQSFII